MKIVTSDRCNILLIRAILAYKTEQVATQEKNARIWVCGVEEGRGDNLEDNQWHKYKF